MSFPRTATSVACVIALACGCTLPRTALIAGAATTIAGAAIIVGASNSQCRAATADCDLYNLLNAPGVVLATALGSALAAAGGGLMIGGLIGLAEERRDAARAAPIGPPGAFASGPPSAISPGPPGATAPGAPDPRAVQLTLEARAGHCASAQAIARVLAAQDPDLVAAQIQRDADVARCLVYRM
jgi:hypothetical protein